MFSRKKVIAILMVIMMLTVFTGCNSEKAPEPAKVVYPENTITIIAPYAPGGAVDILSRTLADYLTKSLGKSVVVVNKPGGGGSIGVAETARAKADGYTLVVASNGGLIVNPYATDVGYTYDSLAPVSLLTEVPIGIGVNAKSDFKTLQDLIEYAKNNPGKVRYATPGANSTPHLSMEILGQKTGAQFSHMPIGSTPQMLAELLGGHIEAVTVNLPSFQTNYEAKTIRVLAITGDSRNEKMPDVPTLKELGYDIPLSVWFGVLAPKDLPAEINDIINREIAKATGDKAITAEWDKIQMAAKYLDAKSFKEKISKDHDLLKPVLESLGLGKK